MGGARPARRTARYARATGSPTPGNGNPAARGRRGRPHPRVGTQRVAGWPHRSSAVTFTGGGSLRTLRRSSRLADEHDDDQNAVGRERAGDAAGRVCRFRRDGVPGDAESAAAGRHRAAATRAAAARGRRSNERGERVGEFGSDEVRDDELRGREADAATSTAGHTPSMPRQPARSTTRYAGMMSEKNGSWRPTMADSAIVVDSTSRPRIGASSPPSVVTGMPSDPNATGAVLATSASTAALMGSNPSPTSIEAVMATGAPKPAIPSTSAPNPNATSSASRRRSVVRRDERPADHIEVAAGHRQVVEEDGAEDHPADRPQAERHAVRERGQGQRRRHAPHRPRERRGGPRRRHRRAATAAGAAPRA